MGGDVVGIGFLLDGGHDDSVDAAGGDVVEASEGFWSDVDGVAVHGDPFADADANRGYFTIFYPYSSEPFAGSGWDMEISAGEDECLFDGADVGVQVFAEFAEVNDGVADELTWTMVGGLPATVDFDVGMGEVGGVEQGGFISGSADGVEWAVL